MNTLMPGHRDPGLHCAVGVAEDGSSRCVDSQREDVHRNSSKERFICYFPAAGAFFPLFNALAAASAAALYAFFSEEDPGLIASRRP
jgi:hypothetical protein